MLNGHKAVVVAAPFATRLLADLGAALSRVEAVLLESKRKLADA